MIKFCIFARTFLYIFWENLFLKIAPSVWEKIAFMFYIYCVCLFNLRFSFSVLFNSLLYSYCLLSELAKLNTVLLGVFVCILRTCCLKAFGAAFLHLFFTAFVKKINKECFLMCCFIFLHFAKCIYSLSTLMGIYSNICDFTKRNCRNTMESHRIELTRTDKHIDPTV